ncbi:MAG: protein-L-isoaspartate O-methyltransferase [Pseudomonadota bacterium]
MNLETARSQMIEQQVRVWEVLDPRVLEIMSQVPRERFVPEALAEVAFADNNIPLAHGQCMMAPCVEGRLLQALGVSGDDTILEVGTGSGFLTACFARLGQSVLSLDYYEDFTNDAQKKLKTLGVNNVTLETQDATTLSVKKKFDVIAITGSTPQKQHNFYEALKVGGRMFVIEGEGQPMEARLVTRLSDSEFSTESLFETSVPALINTETKPAFVF